MNDHTVHNERTKMTATYLNSIAVAALAAGALAPFFALLYGNIASAPGPWFIAIGVAICVVISFALHLGARAVLGRMRT